MEDLTKYYKILEVRPGASWDEIHCAYRESVKVWHPDRFASDRHLQERAQRRLQTINEAYRRLAALESDCSSDRPEEPSDVPPTGAETGATDASRNRWFRWQTNISTIHFPHYFKPDVALSDHRSMLLVAVIAVVTVAGGSFLYRFLETLNGGALSVLDRAANGAGHSVPSSQSTRRISLVAVPDFVQDAGRAVAAGLDKLRPTSGPQSPANLYSEANTAPDSTKTRVRLNSHPKASATVFERERLSPPPANGTELIEPRGPLGAGTIQIQNQRDQDVVADIREGVVRSRIVRSVYVRSHEQVSLNGLGPGIYHAAFETALGLGSVPAGPSQSPVYFRLAETMQFYEVESSRGTQSVLYVITVP